MIELIVLKPEKVYIIKEGRKKHKPLNFESIDTDKTGWAKVIFQDGEELIRYDKLTTINSR